MIEALTELIKTATVTLRLLSTKLEKELERVGVQSVTTEIPVPIIVEALVAKRGRKAKVEAAPVEEPTIKEAVEMDEAESLKELTDTAKAFVQRFNRATTGGKTEGFDTVKALLASKYKVGRLGDLVHAQRIQLISDLKARILEADKVPAAA